MSNAAEELEEYYRKEDALIREMKELDEGTLIPQLKEKKKQLEETMSLLEKEAKETDAERLARIKVQANVETELKNISEKLETELEGYVPNESIEQEVLRELESNPEHTYRRQKLKELEKLRQEIEAEADGRAEARNHFNKEYPAYGFTGVEHGNEVYDKVLEQCRKDFEPKYKDCLLYTSPSPRD